MDWEFWVEAACAIGIVSVMALAAFMWLAGEQRREPFASATDDEEDDLSVW